MNFRKGHVEFRVVAVRFGHKQHHCLSRRAASLHEKLGDAIEVGRVRGRRVANRAEFRFASVPDRVLHVGFLGSHPVQVTLEGVDLTVVTQKAHRLRERPLGRRVCGETTVVNGELSLVVRVFKILVELTQDRRSKHTLVHNSARAQGRNVKVFSQGGVAERLLFACLAGDVQLALERFAFNDTTIDKNLLHHRLRQLGKRTNNFVVHRHRTPAKNLEAFGFTARLQELLRLGSLGAIRRQEDLTNGRGALGKAGNPVGVAPLAQKLPGNVRHHPHTITRVVISRARPAVLHAPHGG
mmetsp:Transcript_6845/g.24932  ORF Transcript_6845/g.24932 Transcript_6845/m.24932 type:complete len:297 (-) Transcript_6845:765-1655(-)